MDRGTGLAADLRTGVQTAARWRGSRRPRSLLAAKRWITVTSAVVGSMLKGGTLRFLHADSLGCAWEPAEAIPAQRREDVESKPESGDRVGTGAGADRMRRQAVVEMWRSVAGSG
jgi:hypothetical protein